MFWAVGTYQVRYSNYPIAISTAVMRERYTIGAIADALFVHSSPRNPRTDVRSPPTYPVPR